MGAGLSRRVSSKASIAEARAKERTTRLAGAAQQFLSPQLSSSQSQLVSGIGSGAALQGLFGGAVDQAGVQTRTRFLAGNRLSGLAGLVQDLFAPDMRGATRAQVSGNENIAAVLSQITGLENQFRFGGQAGFGSVADLNPAKVGEFAGIRQRETLATSGRMGTLGHRQTQLGTPGSLSNELARRFAEAQGVFDVGGFINSNPQLGAAVGRGGLMGLNATSDAFSRSLSGDMVDAGADFQSIVRNQIVQDSLTPKFGIRASLFPEGLQGLAATGLLPFNTGGGTTLAGQLGGSSLDSLRQTGQELFSPLLFGSGV